MNEQSSSRISSRSLAHGSRRRRWYIAAFALATLLVVALAWLRPSFILEGCNLVGYAVCHQIPERSFHLDGLPLPLCARCTGTFLGALLGFTMIFIRRRTRGANVPRFSILALLALFFVLWTVDGLNSYLTLLGDLPHLYEPHNVLRLTTGMLLGIAMSNLIYPVTSMTIWAEPESQRSIEDFGEFGILLLAAGVLILAILSGWPPALYLLSVASSFGVLAMLLIVTMLIAVIALRRENRARRWRDLWRPALIGLMITATMITATDLIRVYLTNSLGLAI